ncbi:YwpF-like family protein [Niallia taxi]|uniref:YwpF-like family protein n=1 Tax=Bacillati TaxID=1783272 RepID=UPI00254C20DC|nr:YwpF-like family protein [Niallia taxi]MDK8640107.1 YwpF-like family protein [Niallia taxi]
MKTFKLISIQLLQGENATAIPILDGLIINKEDDHHNWLIELYMDHPDYSFFENALNTGQKLLVHAVISKKENDPAPFEVVVHSISKFTETISVLLQGSLKRNRMDYAEMLLDHLLESGYEGKALSERFKELMHSKQQLFLQKKPQ